MQQVKTTLALILLPAVGLALSSALSTTPEPPSEFEEASLILEINATDGDAEIVLDLKSEEDLARLELSGPIGSAHPRIFDLRGSRTSKLGISQVEIETGEPDLQTVLEAFPEGIYELNGITPQGGLVLATLELTHELPLAPTIEYPEDGASDIPTSGLVIRWAAGPSARGWVVEVENDDLLVAVLATLPAGTTSFAVPDGFLAAGVEYDFGVRAIHENGNVAVTEASFVTL